MRSAFSLPLLLIAMLTGCAGTTRVSHAYREDEMRPFQGRGTATIEGRVFLTEWDGHIISGEGFIVQLVPSTPYTRERFEIEQGGGTAEPADPGLQAHVREAVTNGMGRFSFGHIPPGRYLLVAWVSWSVPSAYDVHDRVTRTKQVFASTIVAEGETIRVDVTG
jgi:hypothetical protein